MIPTSQRITIRLNGTPKIHRRIPFPMANPFLYTCSL
jgi:hypothetical protein